MKKIFMQGREIKPTIKDSISSPMSEKSVNSSQLKFNKKCCKNKNHPVLSQTSQKPPGFGKSPQIRCFFSDFF